jgi:hypothetical protein
MLAATTTPLLDRHHTTKNERGDLTIAGSKQVEEMAATTTPCPDAPPTNQSVPVSGKQRGKERSRRR